MNPSDQNDPLARTLAAWRIAPPPDPNFRPGVWQRIKQRSAETWVAYLRTHFVAWSVAAGLAFVVAGWTGRTLAQTKLDDSRDRMVVSYLGELDPRVMASLRR